MTFVRADIPSRLLNEFKFPNDIQVLAVELNLKKTKWLLLNIYRNPKQNLTYFLNCLTEAILYYSRYDSILINGDFNVEPTNPELHRFLVCNQLHNHMKVSGGIGLKIAGTVISRRNRFPAAATRIRPLE